MARRRKDGMERALRNLYRDDPADRRHNPKTDTEKRRDRATDILSRMIEKERNRAD